MKESSIQVGQLLLENGISIYGSSIGSQTAATGKNYVYAEVVFNTSMSGYQEILTDPSYLHQIVIFTYPEIGNYGVHAMHEESSKVRVSGMLAKKIHRYNYGHLLHRVNGSANDDNTHTCLTNYLIENNIIALEGIDTRRLTRILRKNGVMRAVLSSVIMNEKTTKMALQQLPNFEKINMPLKVTCKTPYQFTSNKRNNEKNANKKIVQNNVKNSNSLKVGVIDYGAKFNIMRILEKLGMQVHVYPATTSAKEILLQNLNGVLLSNGPGNPANCSNEVETVKELLGKIPIFGICLGHQILALAMGEKTAKLTFGHRGANHPIQSRNKKNITITSQNHGYAVLIKESKEVKGNALQPKNSTKNPCETAKELFLKNSTLNYLNINDFTVAGYKNEVKNVAAVQYHPEGSPGPHDSHYLFAEFHEAVKKHAEKKLEK